MNHAIRRFYLAMKLSLEGTDHDGWTHLIWSRTLNVCCRFLLGWSSASDAKWQVASEYVGGNQDEGSIRVGVVLVSGSTSRFSATLLLSRCYVDSGLLFILQGIYHETISALIPVAVFSVQSPVGIIWIYKEGYNSESSQEQSRTSEFSESNKAT